MVIYMDYYFKNLFNIFPNYSKREILDAFYRLRYDQKKIMNIAFGKDLEKVFQYQELSDEQKKKVDDIIQHIFIRLLNNKDLEVRKNLKLTDYFLTNTFEEIVESISKLDLEKQFLLRKAFGEEYNEHCCSYLLSEKEKNQLYNLIHIKLKKQIESLSSLLESEPQQNQHNLIDEKKQPGLKEAETEENDSLKRNKKYIKRIRLSYYYSAKEIDKEKYLKQYFEIAPRFQRTYEKANEQKKEELLNQEINNSLSWKEEFLNKKERLIHDIIKKENNNIQFEDWLNSNSELLDIIIKSYDINSNEDFDDYLASIIKEKLVKYQKTQSQKEEKKSSIKKRGPKCVSLLEYFPNHTYEELNIVLDYFGNDIKSLFKKAYGDHYDSFEYFNLLTKSEKNTIYRYRQRIQDYFNGTTILLDSKRNRKRHLIDYLNGISYDDLLLILQNFPEEEKELIIQAYGREFNTIDGYYKLSSQEQKQVNSIKRKIKEIVDKQKNKQDLKYSKYNMPMTLIEYFKDYSSEEIKKTVSSLPNKAQNLLYSVYGHNLDQIIQYSRLSSSEKKELFRIKKYLKKYYEGSIDKEYLIMRIDNKIEKGKNLFEYLDNISKEQCLEMISMLSEENQLLLQKVYGRNYDSYNGLDGLDKNSKNKIYRLRSNLKNKKISSNQKTDEITENNKRKSINLQPLIDNYEKITMERLLLEIEKLKIEDKILLQKVYGNNYDLMGSYKSLNEKEKKRVRRIRDIIRKRLSDNKQERKRIRAKSLIEFFKDYSSQQLEQVINSLSLEEQELLRRAYGNDYDDAKQYSQLETYEKQNVANIRTKIKKRLSKKTISNNIVPLDSISSIKAKKYKRLSRREEIVFVKKAKLSYFYDVPDQEKKEYLDYYFEVFPSKKERYQSIISQLESIIDKINNIEESSNIEDLKHYKDEMIRLEEKRKNLLDKYIDDSKRYRDKFLENNLRLVISAVHKLKRYNISIEELISEGNLGLMRALEKFDLKKGNKFSTYATWWIKEKASRYVLDNRNNIRIPVHMGEKIDKIKRQSNDLSNYLYHEPTLEELSEVTGFKKEKIEEILAKDSISNTYSIDSLVGDDLDTELSDLIGKDDSSYEQVDDKVFIEQFYELMKDANLTTIEIYIIERRYGLKDGIARTLKEIGKELGFSIERIRQKEKQAIEKIKDIAEITGFFENRINELSHDYIASDDKIISSKEESNTENDSDYKKLKILEQLLS